MNPNNQACQFDQYVAALEVSIIFSKQRNPNPNCYLIIPNNFFRKNNYYIRFNFSFFLLFMYFSGSFFQQAKKPKIPIQANSIQEQALSMGESANFYIKLFLSYF